MVGIIYMLAGAVALTYLIITVWAFGRSRQMLDEWAASSDLDIISAQIRLLRRGPFFWTSSKNQTVYRITAVDSNGDARDGWARCGSFWWGVFSNQVKVRWDGP